MLKVYFLYDLNFRICNSFHTWEGAESKEDYLNLRGKLYLCRSALKAFKPFPNQLDSCDEKR